MKTTRSITIAIVAFCAMFMYSSDTKQNAISQLEKFNKELYLKSSGYTEIDWKKAELRFLEINDKLTEHSEEYTEAENTYISKLQLECEAYFTKNEIGSFWNDLIDGFTEGVDAVLNAVETEEDVEL